MSRSVIVVGSLAAVLVVGASRRAEACSCVPPPPPKQALARSAAVFEGKIVELAQDEDKHRLTVTFEVSRRWKGADTPRVEVTTVDVGSLCGLPFAQGQEWLIYASGDAGGLSTGLCTRTRLKAEAADDRKALGAGKPAVAASADPLASGRIEEVGKLPLPPGNPMDPLAGDPNVHADPRAPTGLEDPLASGPARAEPGKVERPASTPTNNAPVSTPTNSTPAPAPARAPAPASSSGCTVTETAGGLPFVCTMLALAPRRRRR